MKISAWKTEIPSVQCECHVKSASESGFRKKQTWSWVSLTGEDDADEGAYETAQED